jgi:hypothetical protein
VLAYVSEVLEAGIAVWVLRFAAEIREALSAAEVVLLAFKLG